MTHITILLDAATDARLRQAAEDFGRPVEQLAALAIAEAAHNVFAADPQNDPGRDMGQLHPVLFAEAL